jgi:type I restriction enzyme, S subunit
MTEQTNLIPKRRFKGFQSTHAWELGKLGELADFSKGNGYSKSDLTSVGKPVILYGRLYTKYETIIEYVDTFTLEKEKSVISIGNEVIIPASGESSEDISRASVVSKPGIILGGDLNIVRPSNEIDPVFLALTISNGKQQKELSKRAQGKSVVHLHNSDLKEVDLSLPKKEEQIEIGKFFKRLDNTIVVHQRKLEKTKALKSAYLSELFPAEGEDKPKRRFAGFTQAWEQRKFDEEVEFYSGLTYSPKEVNKSGTFVLRSSNVKNGEIVDADNVYVNSEIVNSSNVKEGDIVVVVRNGSRSLIGKHAQIKKAMDKTVIGAFMTGIRSQQSNFINALLDTHAFKAEVDKNLGATINQITNGMFRDMQFMFPDSEEQKKIGNFFNQLDQLITLHERKVKKLQNLKRAYLHEMFV